MNYEMVYQAQKQATDGTSPARNILQRKCDKCHEKKPALQRSDTWSVSNLVPSIVHEALRSPGQPLDVATRAFMESRFRHDFSRMRVHTDPLSAAATAMIGAHAFTVGQDVVLGSGVYAPASGPGRHLLAHELAHVMQQDEDSRSSGAMPHLIDSPSLEAEADRAAGAVVAGKPVTMRRASLGAGALQRQKTKTPSPIVYVGLTKNAEREAKKVSNINIDRGGATIITTTEPEGQLTVGGSTFDLTTDAGVETFAKSLGVAADVQQKVIDLLKAQPTSERKELASLIKVYAAAETDPSVPRMTRMVLSGHSGGLSIMGSGRRLAFEALVKLAGIFPKAAGQVEHLHMSGCSTGGESTILDFYVKAFPNVKTVWAYAGACPTDWGAVGAIETWESLTEAPGVKKLPKQAGVATWSEGRYEGGEPLDVADALSRINRSESLFSEYFDGTRVDRDPESGPLTTYYRLVVRVVGRPELPADDKKRLTERQKVALRLRFYANVRAKFMTTHGATVRAGYDALKQAMPDYASLSRKDALQAIEAFAAAAAGSDAAAKALDLLQRGLRDLSPTVINETWILP